MEKREDEECREKDDHRDTENTEDHREELETWMEKAKTKIKN